MNVMVYSRKSSRGDCESCNCFWILVDSMALTGIYGAVVSWIANMQFAVVYSNDRSYKTLNMYVVELKGEGGMLPYMLCIRSISHR